MTAVAGELRGALSRHRSLVFLLGLGAVLIVLYWPAASMRGVFYVGDIYRLNYPARQEYALGLRQGHIPLWSENMVAGYPILGEGQTGSYYPPNLVLFRILPVPVALNYSILLAFWTAGMGAFLYLRSLGVRRPAAFLAGCAFMLGGFLPGHLNHLNILAGASWLPLLLWAVERATRRPGWGRWALVGLLFGIQGLAGHPQISLLAGILAAAQAAAGPLVGAPAGLNTRRRLGQVVYCGGALLLGAALAAVQWAPTFELARMSQRGQGLDVDFFMSFSLNPVQYVTMLWPFIGGNPYPLTSLETIGYVGALPLVLAALAPVLRRNRAVGFWVTIVVAAFLLSLGRWNPYYRYLMYVPIVNMFRAPARYMLWLDLGIAVLAGVGLDSLLALTRERVGAQRLAPWAEGGLALVGLGALWTSRISLDGLVASWRFLPVVWLGTSVVALLALALRPPTRVWSALVIGLLLADLGAFNGVYNKTYNDVMPPAEFTQPPEVLRFLQQDAGPEPYRVYTSEKIVPVLSVMRESLYPNTQLLHGIESLSGYYALVPAPARWLLGNVNPRLVNLLNVRYVLIPQVPPLDEGAERYDTEDPFAPSVVGRAFDLPQPGVAALEVEGYLSHSADLADGTPVGEIVLRTPQGEDLVWTLRAGKDLAEWAYTRDDVLKVIRHHQPERAVRAWPARSGLPPRDHQGFTYLAHYDLPHAVSVQQLEVRPLIPAGFLHIERLRLIDAVGKAQLLSQLVGEGDHILVQRSPEVAIYRNLDAGPRAFLVHKARLAANEEEAHRLVAAASFKPHHEVILLEGDELAGEPLAADRVVIEAHEAEYVRLQVATEGKGYLILSDSYYPGWLATIDGRPAKVLCADACVRAVAVPPGQHVVGFRFAPTSWRIGGAVSALAWLAVAGIGFGSLRRAAGR